MLEQVRIKNFGVISDAVLHFTPGLNVLTGETGAGKTMVFRGLNVLFGGKADASFVATGCDQAILEVDAVLPPSAVQAVADTGAVIEEGNFAVIGRQINVAGRSRSFIGGASVPSQVVSDLGEELVAVHGQSEQLRLTKGAQQRLILDRFAAAPKALDAYTSLWAQRVEVEARIKSLSSDAAAREEQLDRISRIVASFDELKPQPGEDLALDEEANRLANSEVLFTAAQSALDALAGSEDSGGGTLSAMTFARKALDRERGHDELLGHLADRIHELEVLTSDVSSELAGYIQGVDASPERLDYVESRRASLRHASREFGGVDAWIEWVNTNRSRIEELAGGDEVIAQLRAKHEELTKALTKAGADLTKVRTKAAEAFTKAVSLELQGLAMAGATVEFHIEPADLGPFGADDIALGLISRPNAPWIPIHKGASGGELSRIMLAVQVVLAAADPIDTFIFDEVDAGVGGAAAVEVGRRLARLARTSQVIVVTHLPQVAAFADNHLVVAKDDSGSLHSSAVTTVAKDHRVTELSRMLAGLADSSAGAQLATELLELADAERKKK